MEWFIKSKYEVKYDFCFSQALLDLYLLENVEESTKHAIVSFLFFFLASSLPHHVSKSILLIF